MRVQRIVSAVLCCILIAGLVAFAPPVPEAQAVTSPWLWRNPFPSGEDLKDTDFITGDLGWAVGRYGTILKTADGGTTWRLLPSGVTDDLMAVAFIDADIGWTAGNNGVMLKTIDGGEHWVPQTVPGGSSSHCTDIEMFNAMSGVALASSGQVFATSNGGTDWGLIATRSEAITKFDFIDSLTGWAVGGSGAILKTSDGGVSWTPQASGVTDNLHGVEFADASVGCAVGAGGRILNTANGGTTWVAQTYGNPAYESVLDVGFSNASVGWAVGNSFGMGRVYKTTNGGVSWTQAVTWASKPAGAVDVVDSATARAVGASGFVLRTDDGTAWSEPRTSVTWDDIENVQFLDASNGWAVGKTRAYRTTDGGTTWTPYVLMSNETFRGLHFRSASQGWVVGTNGHIFTTSNGGTDWTQQTSGTGVILESVWFASPLIGWTVGSGVILKTTDGGATWNPQTAPTTGAIYEVRFATESVGWAVGGAGHIFKTVNGGTEWVQQSTPVIAAGQTIEGLEVLDANTVWVCCSPGGFVAKTTNGGTDWVRYDLPSVGYPKDIEFVDANTGWVVGLNGVMAKTTDGGMTWNTEQFSLASLASVSPIDADKAWAVGAAGAMASTAAAAPLVGTFVLQDNAEYWNDWIVTLHSNVPLATQMRWRFDLNDGAGWSPWSPYVAYDPAKQLGMAADGREDWEVEYTDGVRTLMLSDHIILDTIAPKAPTVVATTLSTSAIKLAWSGAVDDRSGIAGYKVYQGGGLLATLGSGASEYTVTGLSSGTSYTFSVKAVDAAGNLSVARTASATTTALTTIYRFYNPDVGTHFYAGTPAERDYVLATWPDVFDFEGGAYSVDPSKDTQPLYRFYGASVRSHFYTPHYSDVLYVLATWPDVYVLEGAVYNVSIGPSPGAIPVYRFYNMKNGSHFFTASLTEANIVRATWPDVYKDEGIGFWARP